MRLFFLSSCTLPPHHLPTQASSPEVLHVLTHENMDKHVCLFRVLLQLLVSRLESCHPAVSGNLTMRWLKKQQQLVISYAR